MSPIDPADVGIQNGAALDLVRRQAFDLQQVGQKVELLERKSSSGLGAGSVPIGGVIDYYGTTEPAGWLFPNGQAIPAQYVDGITIIGANTPDLRGRVAVALDNMGGSDAGRLAAANTLGGAGGTETHQLAANESGQPGFSQASGTESAGHTHTTKVTASTAAVAAGVATFVVDNTGTTATGAASNTHTHTTTVAAAAAANAHNNMQPYMLVNKLIRVA